MLLLGYMIAVVLILLFVICLVFFSPIEEKKKKKEEEKSSKYTAQMKKLWQIAQTAMRERKPLRAEKALLTILKFDEKNAAAYNRLGILYAKSKKYDEAVECFEIAQSLDNNPASIHNVGLIYLETGAYEKAAMAFRQAIELEGDVAARYIALAKAEEKLGNMKRAIKSLEDAYELDPKVSTLRQMLAIYEGMGDTEAATATSARIEEQIIRNSEAKKKTAAKRSRRLVGKTKAEKTTAKTIARVAKKGKSEVTESARRVSRATTRSAATVKKPTVRSATTKVATAPATSRSATLKRTAVSPSARSTTARTVAAPSRTRVAGGSNVVTKPHAGRKRV